MKRQLIMLLASLIVLAGVLTAVFGRTPETYEKYSDSFFDTFDTIVSVYGYATSEQAFQKEMNEVKHIFTRYHKLFDNYNEYEGINNLYVINRDAGRAPVKVDAEMIAFLKYVMALEEFTGTDEVNIAMGSVLRLWHDAREESAKHPESARVPEKSVLEAAKAHTDIHALVIDEKNSTVFFTDPELKLDFGAVAKGYAAEKAGQYLEQSSMPSFIISAGGNVRAGQKPADGREFWTVGVQDPLNPQGLMDAVSVNGMSVVTSGDYQRFYMLDGVRYHHIISPGTLMPADNFRAVTVITKDSAWADYLSTRLFIMSYEEGLTFIKSLRTLDAWDDVEIIWVFPDGSVKMTDGYKQVSATYKAQ